jgi:MraZ protein
MRFRGITKLSVDAKGRLAVPKGHRDRLESNGIGELVVTADPSKCLLVYPKPIWHEIEEQLIAVPNSSPYTRMIQRLYIGYATEIELDGTGRMLLPAELRDYAGIDRKAVLIGQGKKFELWDERTWEVESDNWKQQVNELDPSDLPVELQKISF